MARRRSLCKFKGIEPMLRCMKIFVLGTLFSTFFSFLLSVWVLHRFLWEMTFGVHCRVPQVVSCISYVTSSCGINFHTFRPVVCPSVSQQEVLSLFGLCPFQPSFSLRLVLLFLPLLCPTPLLSVYLSISVRPMPSSEKGLNGPQRWYDGF